MPSAGVNGSRSNGLAANNVTITKNTVTALVTPATCGSRWSYLRDVSHCASAPKIESTTAQNKRLPAWPP